MPWKEWALASEVNSSQGTAIQNRPKPHIARAHSLLKKKRVPLKSCVAGFHDWIKEKI